MRVRSGASAVALFLLLSEGKAVSEIGLRIVAGYVW